MNKNLWKFFLWDLLYFLGKAKENLLKSYKFLGKNFCTRHNR